MVQTACSVYSRGMCGEPTRDTSLFRSTTTHKHPGNYPAQHRDLQEKVLFLTKFAPRTFCGIPSL